MAADRRGLPPTIKQLFEEIKFSIGGQCGDTSAVVALPYVLIARCCFSALSPAPDTRNDPPNRSCCRLSSGYAEETAAVVDYLVKVRRLLPEQIAVFARETRTETRASQV